MSEQNDKYYLKSETVQSLKRWVESDPELKDQLKNVVLWFRILRENGLKIGIPVHTRLHLLNREDWELVRKKYLARPTHKYLKKKEVPHAD